MTSFHRIALAAALAAAASVPASAQNREQRQMMADLRILQVQAQEMQNMVGALNQALSDALKAINARLNEQAEATRRSFAEQKSIIDTLSNDLRIVREKLDDNNVRVGIARAGGRFVARADHGDAARRRPGGGSRRGGRSGSGSGRPRPPPASAPRRSAPTTRRSRTTGAATTTWRSAASRRT